MKDQFDIIKLNIKRKRLTCDPAITESCLNISMSILLGQGCRLEALETSSDAIDEKSL